MKLSLRQKKILEAREKRIEKLIEKSKYSFGARMELVNNYGLDYDHNDGYDDGEPPYGAEK